MIPRILRLTAIGICLTLALAACTPSKGPQANHKPATSACLMTTDSNMPGNPDKQLGADLVEAQVIYGIRVKEVSIPKYSDKMSRLLKSLQNGCVLMVSSDLSLLESLSTFAKLHSKMMVLFVGGAIPEIDQPKNFRWLADDLSSGAKMAGYVSASLGPEVNLFIQKNYFQAKTVQTGFAIGVAAFNRDTSNSVKLNVEVVTDKASFAKKFQGLVEPSVVALFAGKSYWSEIGSTESQLVGADLQFGQTKSVNPKVVASLERNTSPEILRAVSSLLGRNVNSSPSYRKSNALKAGRILLKTDEGLAPGLADYRAKLLEVNK